MTVVTQRRRSAIPRSGSRPWRILCGLVVSGFLLALPGGLLPLWGFHIQPDFGTAANFFLVLGAGLVAGRGARPCGLPGRMPLQRLLAGGCFGGGAGAAAAGRCRAARRSSGIRRWRCS